MILASFLGIQSFPLSIRSCIYRALILWTLTNAILNITVTYQILYVYDTIGIDLAGIYLAVLMLTVTLLDYPTGSLSDWLGQKGVLMLTFITHSLGILLFVFASSLSQFILIALIFGFSRAQLSGTIDTWFDNN
ncbi:MAG: hypothetical protein ACW967_00415, partial [Candidatus Hodarchaeales archaeon]